MLNKFQEKMGASADGLEWHYVWKIVYKNGLVKRDGKIVANLVEATIAEAEFDTNIEAGGSDIEMVFFKTFGRLKT